jgi:hypothetical protein
MKITSVLKTTALLCGVSAALLAQGRGGAPPTAKAAAPVDYTGYWVSQIVDEWRFRVVPQKGDIPYLPINADARRVANAWDAAKDEAEGNQCKAYGAVGVMQRPGRLHITWTDDNTLQIEADAGTQTRALHFSGGKAAGEATWQGYSVATWDLPRVGRGATAGPLRGANTLKVVTTNLKPGYIRKNGVPYSANAVLTEYFNLVTGAGTGAQAQPYIAVTAFVEDPMYLNGPFIRTYTFKKETDGARWEPTPCWAK